MIERKYMECTQSNWLRYAKSPLLQRDPVTALNDAEQLAEFAKKRLANLLRE